MIHLHDSEQKECTQASELDQREPELGLTKCLHAKQLEAQEQSLG
jgi:hypothetical protein